MKNHLFYLLGFHLKNPFMPALTMIVFFNSLVGVNAQESNNTLNKLIAKDATPQLLANGFKFTEGPAADAKGNIYFTDIGSDRIHYWDASNEKLSTIRENSGGADGMFVDRNGALWICELKNKKLTRLNPDGTYDEIIDSYKNKPLTGANDLWMDPYGGIYFSDSYGGSQVRTNDHRVFYLTPEGTLKLVADNFYKSNGIQGTPDGKWLYIADYIKNIVYRYEIIRPGEVGERTVFAKYRCDGMTLDAKDNLYLCTGNAGHGVVVFSPEGKELGKIKIPEDPANICFGGPDNKTLYIAATHGFYALRMNVSGSYYNSPQKTIFTDDGGLMSLVKKDALPKRLANGFRIAQGPAVDKKGNIYFSDIYNHRILKWSFGKDSLNVVREQQGGPDGLFVEPDGSVLVCELLGKRFARLTTEGHYTIIAETFGGTPLTGPNDVYVDSEGGIYFSDSYAGLKVREPKHCVYYIPPGSSNLKQIINDHYKTKGIHISGDGKWIYIADFGGRKVYRYELISPGVLGKKELFIDTRCGGLTVDEKGNVYISTVDDSNGVLVFDSNGKQLGKIMFPENTTNTTFAGPNRDKLIVTTFNSIYALDMNVKGMH